VIVLVTIRDNLRVHLSAFRMEHRAGDS
jgi:hypothetical protein